ncbi:beclin-1-like protein B [Teleopsis dalmanni]|uniref:beclin-1-like protein B n=1 Tax=Teleopsis dalmanni TaxID=139649 RepID=UPI0018CD9465|nr:beclin-1-like protein B [Teleopsis dalmanni]
MNKSNQNFNKTPKTPNPSGGRSSITSQAPTNNQPSRASAQAVRTSNAPSLSTLATVPGGNAASCSSASAAVKANTPTAPSAISTNSTSGTRSHPNPSTRAYRARSSAYCILSRLNAADPSSLSESDKASLKWARENVNLRPSDITSTSAPAQKRQRSIEQAGKSIPSSAPKRSKFGPPRPSSLSKPLSEIVKESLT